MTQLRPWYTKAVLELGALRGVEKMPHREVLARISDRYGWGSRGDTERGPGSGQRCWTETEASALVEVCRLRNIGLEWDLIDKLVSNGMTGLVSELEESLTLIRLAQPTAA